MENQARSIEAWQARGTRSSPWNDFHPKIGPELIFPLTSENYTLHPRHPEVVLGPGAVVERVGLFAFSDSRQGPASTGRRDGSRGSRARALSAAEMEMGEWLALQALIFPPTSV